MANTDAKPKESIAPQAPVSNAPGNGRRQSPRPDQSKNQTPARRPGHSRDVPHGVSAELEGHTTDDLMALFRKTARGAGQLTEDDPLRAVAGRLGYTRLGKNIRVQLIGPLRTAICRQIIARNGDHVYAAASTGSPSLVPPSPAASWHIKATSFGKNHSRLPAGKRMTWHV